MSDDLKPCPFCGEKYVTTEFDRGQGDKWGYASCDVCAACGPEVRTNYDREPDGPWHSEAIAAWNTRADADRIEELERDYKEACNEAADCYTKQCVAEARLAKAVEALTVVVPTEAQICSACLSYDHSFGLMDGPQRVAMMHEAREWLHAWRKEDRAVLAELEGGK